jgi:DnaJ-class molecular chaperone
MIAAATFWKKWNAPFHSTFDETYECVACGGLVSIKNTFCKHCGGNISTEDREEMKGENNPNKIHGYVIGIPFFLGTAIALTIIFLILGVK